MIWSLQSPFNATKVFEYGHENALSPCVGTTVEAISADLAASTCSEAYGTAKTGGGAIPGFNATNSSLDRVRAEPVFGNLRHNKRLDRFTLRGQKKVDAQWKLYCMVHNIEKLAHHGYAQ